MKIDERILGDDDFVSETLQKAEEFLERSFVLKTQGVDVKLISKGCPYGSIPAPNAGGGDGL